MPGTPVQNQPKDTMAILLLDRSRSMIAIKDNTIKSVNLYKNKLAESDDNIYLTLVQFDTIGTDVVYKHRSPKEAPDLDDGNFQPRGATPLIDALVKTIHAVDKDLAGKDVQVAFNVMSDGEENSSTEYSYSEAAKLIADKTALGWQFTFMGAGFDAYTQSAKFGLTRGQTMSYVGENLAQSNSAFAAHAHNTKMYASGASQSMIFSDQQKKNAGDKYATIDQGQSDGALANPNQASLGMYHTTLAELSEGVQQAQPTPKQPEKIVMVPDFSL